jgi:hypothetical protein
LSKTYPRFLDTAATKVGRAVDGAAHLPLLLSELVQERELAGVDGGSGGRWAHPEATHRPERGLLHGRLSLVLGGHRRELHRNITEKLDFFLEFDTIIERSNKNTTLPNLSEINVQKKR